MNPANVTSLLAGFGIGIVLLGGPSPVRGQDSRCGSYCLYVALRALERGPVTFEELEVRLGEPDSGGYSLAELRTAATASGAHALGVRTNLDNLVWRNRAERFVALAHVRETHFILIYDISGESIRFCDPPRVAEVPRDTFAANWSGDALLISAAPMAPEEAVASSRAGSLWWRRVLAWCGVVLTVALAAGLAWSSRKRMVARRLAVSSAVVASIISTGCGQAERDAEPDPGPSAMLTVAPETTDLGVIVLERPDQIVDAETMIHNPSSRTIRITGLVSSCSCSEVRVIPEEIPPGGRARLTAGIKLLNTNDKGTSQVRLVTEPTLDRDVHALFTWETRNPLRPSVPQIVLADLLPGERRLHREPIACTPIGFCDGCDFLVTTSSQNLWARFVGGDVIARTGHATALIDGDPVLVGHVEIEAGPLDQEFSEATVTTLSVLCRAEVRARLILPVSWRVTPLITHAPRRLYFGVVTPRAELIRQLTVRSSDGSEFRVLGLEAEGIECSMIREIDDAEATSAIHVLDLKLVTPDALGSWAGKLRLQTDLDRQPELIVPVAGVVETEP